MDNDSSGTSPANLPGLPGLPEHVLQEKFIESPQQQLVLERRAVGKFLKGDTTPDVADVEHWIAQNIVSTLVTKFEHGQPGQHLYILGDGQTTLKHGTSIFMTGGADLLLAASQVYHFVGYAQSPVVFYQVIDTGGGGGGGAVDSVFGRVGVVTALQADYDAFFLTPAEGDALFLTPAEGNAAYSVLGHIHDDRYFTEAESDARFAPIAHTHPAADIVSGILDVARIPDLNASKITAGTMATARLGGGVADGTTFLRGDSTWAVPPGGGGGVTGAGTIGTIPKWTAATALGDSILSQIGVGGIMIGASADAGLRYLAINAAAGQFKDIQLYSGGLDRWIIGANDTAETGANAGSDLRIRRYSDTGALLGGGDLLRVTRSTGQAIWFGDWRATKFIVDGGAWIDSVGGADWLTFTAGGGARWHINSSGHLIPNIDNLYQVGSSTLAPTIVYAGPNGAYFNGDAVRVIAGEPGFLWTETDGPVDENEWRMYCFGGEMHFQTVNDAYSAASDIFIVHRTGQTVNSINFGAKVVVPSLDIGADVALSQAGASLKFGDDATWNTLQFYTQGAERVQISSSGWLTNMAVAGAGGFWDKARRAASADQATFANVQTNITGMEFDTATNVTYDVDVVLHVTMVSTAGVKFYFTGPAGMTGEIHYFGSTTPLITAFRHDYQAVLTVPAVFYCTVAGSGYYTLRATIRIAGTSSMVRLVGITGAAGTTCAVKKGSCMTFHRSGQ